ncbi:hypothetical protein LCGC14_2260970 [marine sediment metagenome]|uniref:Uncharacterized protein n=1 Tax=marine sediment metagenome TaxID=412755 RepID=A0A0F9CZQ5_9ZZZZ
MQATNFHCAKCGAEITGVAQQLGKKKNDRKVYCLKCARSVNK